MTRQELLEIKPKRPSFNLDDARHYGMEFYERAEIEHRRKLIEWTALGVECLLKEATK